MSTLQEGIRHDAATYGAGSIAKGRPQVWRAFLSLADEVMHKPSGLSALEREVIGAYVSKRSGSGFCQCMHLDTVDALGGTSARRLVDEPTDELIPLFDLADKLVVGSASSEDFERARAAGRSEAELEDVVFVAAFFGFANRMMDGFGLEYVAERDRETSRALAQGYTRPAR